jgi:glycosyltransferase involved in cell wall biosynthesis
VKILIVSRSRLRFPLDESTRRKFEALGDVAELRVLASAAGEGADGAASDDSFRLVRPMRPRLLDGLLFHASLPVRVGKELREFEPDAVLVQGVHDVPAVLAARTAVGSNTRIVADLHGDWRQSARLYGSPLRKLLAPLVDLLARIGIRRADAVRTLSPFTSDLVRSQGVEPVAEFPAFVDFDVFRDRPRVAPPARPALLFVGVLEEYKGIDVLADAWRLAAPRVPDAELRLIGRGSRFSVVEQLLTDLPLQTRWHPAFAPGELARELDDATALVLPSRSEGLPRIVIEAFCRGRPVVGARAGGIVDEIRDGENGVLVEAESVEALADAIVDVLVDREWGEQLAAGAARSAEEWVATPEQFAHRVRELVANLD